MAEQPHVYVSVETVEEWARLLGWKPPEPVDPDCRRTAFIPFSWRWNNKGWFYSGTGFEVKDELKPYRGEDA